MADVELRVFPDADAAADACAQLLVAAHGHVALTAGSARLVYERAGAARHDWSDVELWWGDERCVPPEHEWSNFGLVQRTIIDSATTPPRAVHRVRGELPAPEAAKLYDDELAGMTLDFAVLGIGRDGHAASLYPRAPSLRERDRRAIAAEAKLEPYVDRVTMTLPMLTSARSIAWFVVGAEKAEAARGAFAAEPSEDVPASLIRSSGGPTVAILDQEAASLIQN